MCTRKYFLLVILATPNNNNNNSIDFPSMENISYHKLFWLIGEIKKI